MQSLLRPRPKRQAEQRHRRLASVLEQQRALGHFDATNECQGILRALETRSKRGSQGGASACGGRGAKKPKPAAAAPEAPTADDVERRKREREAARQRLFGPATTVSADLPQPAQPPPAVPPAVPLPSTAVVPLRTPSARSAADADHTADAGHARKGLEAEPEAVAEPVLRLPRDGSDEKGGVGAPLLIDAASSAVPSAAEPSTNAVAAGDADQPRAGRKKAHKPKGEAPKPASPAKPPLPATSAGGSSLYERLLAKDIREDRSRLLQAIRFFVSRGFFAEQKLSIDEMPQAS